MRIDFVAPPFAGHLFPLLDLASHLQAQGLTGLRVLSTEDAGEAIRLCGLTSVALLPGLQEQVWAIANVNQRVGFHPLRLYRQFRSNLALMARLRGQLRELWRSDRPRLVIGDFTIPAAGLLAQDLGIPWWTSLPSPCVLETRTGVPSYLGGWRPRNDLFGLAHDALGRKLIRLFKRGIGALFARELRALSVCGVYREDGSELIYSPECILALGMREFELERDWPPALRFIGPLTAAPPYGHAEPDFPPGKRCVLVSLGTHLHWARRQAAALVSEVARMMPDCVFHFTFGKPGSSWSERRENVYHYGFLPYDQYLSRYDAALIHGGAGITYSCIRAGVPMLVWPHDYDQYDHAVRIVERGLGLRLQPRRAAVVRDLRLLLGDESLRPRVRAFRELARRYDAHGWVLAAVRRLQDHAVGGT